jgi:hypothetical protein
MGIGEGDKATFADLAKMKIAPSNQNQEKNEIAKMVKVQGRRGPTSKSRFTVTNSTKSQHRNQSREVSY